MTSPDLDVPARVRCSIAAKSPFGSVRSCVPAVVVSILFGAAQCRAQDPAQDQTQNRKDQSVAEAARQERARKENHQKKSKHVYTVEDLRREQILTPEDRAQLEARKNQQPAPANLQQPQDTVAGSAVAQDVSGPAVTSDVDAAASSANSANVPLGDVARRFRKEKQSQQLQRSAEFHLPFADAPILASPKAPAQPLVPPAVTVPPPVVNPAPRVVAPMRPFVKRSPFERPRVLLAPPVVSAPRAIVPAPLAPRVLPTPAAPRVTLSPAISGKLIMVTVKPGDTLWKFAASRLGNSRRWQELLALNPGLRNPDILQVGSQIVVPASLAAPPAPVKYTVRHGDTLWTIAQAQLGRGSFWSCIAQANPELQDANLIHEGQVLLLPASCLPQGF